MNLIKLCAVCSVLLLVAVAQEMTTIRIQLSSEEIDDVTFDATRISGTEVSRCILLSEYGPHAEVDFGTGLCFRVPPAESTRKQQEIDRARATQSKIRKRISDLDNDHYPAELAGVVSYLKRQLFLALVG